MFLISDNIDTCTGMRLAGVEGVVVHERDELKDALEKAIANKEIGILLLTEKFGLQMALQKLYDAGYLVKNSEGWQMQVRLPMEEKLRKRFYAIRASVRFDGETAD